jgi:Tfp pilus assembly protein PilN
MRFNYLSDAPPELVERLRPGRVPARLKSPLCAVATSIVIVFTWWTIERMQIEDATHELALAQARAAASRLDVARATLRQSQVEALLVLDKRVRSIRGSGSRLAANLATLANRIPKESWLTSIEQLDGGIEIDGNALGVDGLAQTLADLIATTEKPTLIRAGRDDRTGSDEIIAFRVRLVKSMR